MHMHIVTLSMSLSDSEEQGDEKWGHWSESDEAVTYQPFFAEGTYQTLQEALEQDRHFTNGAVDLLEWIRRLELDTYGVTALINYLRSLGRDLTAGLQFSAELQEQGKRHWLWQDPQYLSPTVQDDPFLQIDFQDLLCAQAGEGDVQETGSELAALQLENLKLKQQLEWLQLDAEGRDGIQSILTTERNGKSSLPDQGQPSVQSCTEKAYFQSYSTETIHREMLSDKVRTEAYQQAIEGRDDLFQGKTVLDVGCGTGILSLMACRAGAKHVYSVDASPWAASMAQQLAEENGYEDRITVIHGKIEDLNAGFNKVDIIISEWMGYALLFESMLDSVLHARDHWLKPDGLILPDNARICIAGASENVLDLEFWEDVYGFSMMAIARDGRQNALKTPLVHCVYPEQILTEALPLKEFDLYRATTSANFTADFMLRRLPDGEDSVAVSAIVVWFEVDFSSPEDCIKIDTSPFSPSTHWAQTILALQTPIAGDLSGTLSFDRDPDSRCLTISLTCQDSHGCSQTRVYTMAVK